MYLYKFKSFSTYLTISQGEIWILHIIIGLRTHYISPQVKCWEQGMEWAAIGGRGSHCHQELSHFPVSLKKSWRQQNPSTFCCRGLSQATSQPHSWSTDSCRRWSGCWDYVDCKEQWLALWVLWFRVYGLLSYRGTVKEISKNVHVCVHYM